MDRPKWGNPSHQSSKEVGNDERLTESIVHRTFCTISTTTTFNATAVGPCVSVFLNLAISVKLSTSVAKQICGLGAWSEVENWYIANLYAFPQYSVCVAKQTMRQSSSDTCWLVFRIALSHPLRRKEKKECYKWLTNGTNLDTSTHNIRVRFLIPHWWTHPPLGMQQHKTRPSYQLEYSPRYSKFS